MSHAISQIVNHSVLSAHDLIQGYLFNYKVPIYSTAYVMIVCNIGRFEHTFYSLFNDKTFSV